MKKKLVAAALFSQTRSFIPCLLFKCIYSVFKFEKKVIDKSFHGGSFLLWSFHIWDKVMSNTCYIFSPLFQFHCFTDVATNFTFTLEISVSVLLLKCLPSNAAKKLVVKIVELKLEEAFFDGIRRNVQLGQFILMSVPNFQQLPRPTTFYLFSFLEWPLKVSCIFRWQQFSAFEQWKPNENWKFFSCK